MAENGGKVVKKITFITVDIQEHLKRVNFDIIRINTYDAILGLAQLEKYNLTINYKERTMNFDSYGYKPEKNINIEEMLIRAINAYLLQYWQNSRAVRPGGSSLAYTRPRIDGGLV